MLANLLDLDCKILTDSQSLQPSHQQEFALIFVHLFCYMEVVLESCDEIVNGLVFVPMCHALFEFSLVSRFHDSDLNKRYFALLYWSKRFRNERGTATS